MDRRIAQLSIITDQFSRETLITDKPIMLSQNVENNGRNETWMNPIMITSDKKKYQISSQCVRYINGGSKIFAPLDWT